ncbi:NfeD family protein [Pseudomarimonas arenosa]|uniref:NfeD family protein n=1 Tax=Pseudomarimonas arenosa TaxID=2774145 RepID=A0AAW3ZJ77_9GAMM|nr:NfeD family protein [Pseudomarimonas arenosa]MBD8526143.1 NfeD family protein [Pseudomarimonas arenosa]
MNSTWFWWALALALFAAEALVPGAFMLWLGIAATATGLVHLALPESSLAVQWIWFSLFALASTYAGWRYKLAHPPRVTDQPLLNKRAAQLMDRVLTLDAPIENGRGKVKIGDALWSVSGDDLAAGTRVRVIAIEGMVLRVRAID